MREIDTKKEYDAIVVGSGAGGGMSAFIMANQGMKIAVLEAGPYFDPKDKSTMTQMKWPWESPRRGASTKRAFGDYDMSWGDWKVEGEPYTNEPGTNFMWWRSRMLGGRTNHWGRISLRFGPMDFKHKDVDGLGENWPISYDEVKPFYDRLDKLVGVFGTNEGLPNDPDGFFLPPPKPRLHELYYMKGAKKTGIPVYPSRLSILTKAINKERGVCFYCGQCNRSCNAYADFSSGSVFIFPAQKSGQVDLFTNAMVKSVTTNDEGIATGVSFINKEDLQEYKLKSRAVVLGASACSSARILLNSKSKQHPNGLGNSSDHVGRYLHDSTGAGLTAFVPALMDRKIYNEDGVGGLHVYSPWWGNNKKLDFPRGYHIEIWGGLGMPAYGFGFNVEGMNKYIGGAVGGVDKFGIPVLKFNYQWSDYERLQAKHMVDTFEEITHNMGGTVIGDKPGKDKDYGLLAPGQIIHEVGTTRMGNNPKTSVTNKWQQLHDAKNVYVVDAGPFTSQADKNCTWTIMALSMRATEHLVSQFKKREI